MVHHQTLLQPGITICFQHMRTYSRDWEATIVGTDISLSEQRYIIKWNSSRTLAPLVLPLRLPNLALYMHGGIQTY